MVSEKVRVRLLLSYDGTDFLGWQKQPHSHPTLQGLLEETLSKIYNQPISVVGSGRTDRGVHALRQWAHCDLPLTRDLKQLQYRLNRMTPNSISVRRAEIAPPEFHAQISAVSKTYIYRISTLNPSSPFRQRYTWCFGAPLNLNFLQQISSELVGVHDFACFQSKGTDVTTTVREIFDCQWTQSGRNLIQMRIHGSGFLKQMVRNIVATLIALHEKKASHLALKDIILSKNRQLVPAPAPAQGLFLTHVEYPDSLDNKCRKL